MRKLIKIWFWSFIETIWGEHLKSSFEVAEDLTKSTSTEITSKDIIAALSLMEEMKREGKQGDLAGEKLRIRFEDKLSSPDIVFPPGQDLEEKKLRKEFERIEKKPTMVARAVVLKFLRNKFKNDKISIQEPSSKRFRDV